MVRMDSTHASADDIISALKLIKADFDGRPTHPVVGKGGRVFEFFPTSITDNIPPLHPDLSRAICLLSELHLDHVHTATLGVGEEDRGAMIISDILLHYNLPRTLARWTPTGAPGEIQVPLANEYIQEGNTRVFLNGVRPHDRVVIVDDLISTGGNPHRPDRRRASGRGIHSRSADRWREGRERGTGFRQRKNRLRFEDDARDFSGASWWPLLLQADAF